MLLFFDMVFSCDAIFSKLVCMCMYALIILNLYIDVFGFGMSFIMVVVRG